MVGKHQVSHRVVRWKCYRHAQAHSRLFLTRARVNRYQGPREVYYILGIAQYWVCTWVIKNNSQTRTIIKTSTPTWIHYATVIPIWPISNTRDHRSTSRRWCSNIIATFQNIVGSLCVMCLVLRPLRLLPQIPHKRRRVNAAVVSPRRISGKQPTWLTMNCWTASSRQKLPRQQQAWSNHCMS